jgi:hypothetical protein
MYKIWSFSQNESECFSWPMGRLFLNIIPCKMTWVLPKISSPICSFLLRFQCKWVALVHTDNHCLKAAPLHDLNWFPSVPICHTYNRMSEKRHQHLSCTINTNCKLGQIRRQLQFISACSSGIQLPSMRVGLQRRVKAVLSGAMAFFRLLLERKIRWILSLLITYVSTSYACIWGNSRAENHSCCACCPIPADIIPQQYVMQHVTSPAFLEW